MCRAVRLEKIHHLCPVSFELPAAPVPNVELPYIEEASEKSAEGLFITHTDTENIILPQYSESQNKQPEQVTAIPESETAPIAKTPVKKQLNLIVLASYIWALAVCAMIFRGVISWIGKYFNVGKEEEKLLYAYFEIR